MPAHAKEPLRALSEEERQALKQISRAQSESAAVVTRAKQILAVAEGARFTEAARGSGRRSGAAVSALVRAFNARGLEALRPIHGGGPAIVYGMEERAMILAEFQRAPDREQDGTATWSISTLTRVLRRKGLPRISEYTVLCTLNEAGYTYQEDRTWCHTGRVLRRRKSGVVEVTDPEGAPKRGADPAGLRRRRGSRSPRAERGRGGALPGHPTAGSALGA